VVLEVVVQSDLGTPGYKVVLVWIIVNKQGKIRFLIGAFIFLDATDDGFLIIRCLVEYCR
jgi:hypothetical protein